MPFFPTDDATALQTLNPLPTIILSNLALPPLSCCEAREEAPGPDQTHTHNTLDGCYYRILPVMMAFVCEKVTVELLSPCFVNVVVVMVVVVVVERYGELLSLCGHCRHYCNDSVW